MQKGKGFEVSKEVYERAKAYVHDKDRESFYMTPEDQKQFFSEAILCGYGLYNCQIHEEDGKYLCTYWIGDSCD